MRKRKTRFVVKILTFTTGFSKVEWDRLYIKLLHE